MFTCPCLLKGIELKPIYTAEDVNSLKIDQESGKFPFTRGPYATMYTHRPWTIRQVQKQGYLCVCSCVCILVCRF